MQVKLDALGCCLCVRSGFYHEDDRHVGTGGQRFVGDEHVGIGVLALGKSELSRSGSLTGYSREALLPKGDGFVVLVEEEYTRFALFIHADFNGEACFGLDEMAAVGAFADVFLVSVVLLFGFLGVGVIVRGKG